MTSTSTEQLSVLLKYERLASFVADLVDRGTLRAGMRAPSLRELAKQHGTSLSTAMQAYQLLEERGVLESRPRSGFYVTVNREPGFSPPSSSSSVWLCHPQRGCAWSGAT